MKIQAIPTDPHDLLAFDSRVQLANLEHLTRTRVPVVGYEVSSRYVGWNDLAFLFSLLTVTPMPSARRFRAIVQGSIASALFIWWRMWMSALFHLGQHPEVDWGSQGGVTGRVIDAIYTAFIANNLEAGLLFGLVTWGVLAFTPEQWTAWIAQPIDSTIPRTAPPPPR